MEVLDLPLDQQAAAQILLSLGRWGRLPETKGMVDWLKTELTRLDAANRRELNEAITRQRQGGSQVVEDLLRMAEEADDKAEKIRANLDLAKQRKGVQT